VNIPDALTAPLAALTEALGDPVIDLQDLLAVVIDDLTALVPSLLGLTIALPGNSEPVTLTAIAPQAASAIRTTLRLPIRDLVGGQRTGTMKLYAGCPGAFAELAAETRRVFGQHGQVVVDADLAQPPSVAGLTGTDDITAVNRAVGVLIAEGHTPSGAHAELSRRALRSGNDRPAAARHLLDPAAGDGSGDR
jgi:hypothetical protein